MEKVLLAVLVAIVIVIPMYLVETAERFQGRGDTASIISNALISNKKDGKITWLIQARRMSIAPDVSNAVLNGITVDVTSESAKVAADLGNYDFGTRNLLLTGRVQAVTKDLVITGNTAMVKAETGEITSDGEITVTGRNISLRGTGLWMLGNKMRVIKNVRADIK